MERDALLASLADVVGARHVLADPAELAPYCTDWRRRYSALALAVVRPATTAEVAAVVRCCAQAGVAIVPQGGNTGLAGGAVPAGTGSEVVLSLARLARIRALDQADGTLVAEAGCVLARVQEAAQAAGWYFPVSLAAEGSCTVGGIVSTNAGGVNVLRYGSTREQVLGLEVVLPDGRVWDGLRRLRKDNSGYDLKQLYIGAEGTLGVVTAAALRLRPRPGATATAWLALASPAAALALLGRLQSELGEAASAFELLSRRCLEAVLAHAPAAHADPLPAPHPWYVLAEFEALAARVEAVLADAMRDGLLADGALAQSHAQAAAFWRLRETIPEAQFANVKHDVSVPVSRVPELIERAEAALARSFAEAVSYVFGHVGDGNLHYNVGPASLLERRAEVNGLLHDIVESLGGSISAEHGIGQAKRAELRRRRSAVELELMQAVKRALDPRGLLNPGKVL